MKCGWFHQRNLLMSRMDLPLRATRNPGKDSVEKKEQDVIEAKYAPDFSNEPKKQNLPENREKPSRLFTKKIIKTNEEVAG